MIKNFLTAGVVGAGMMARRYIGNLQERFPVIRVKSVCAAHFDHAQAVAEQYGVTACTFEEMLADPEIELIINLTPASAHYEIVKAALLAGKHVYTEKTMTDSFDKAQELAALAEEKKLYLGSAPDTFLGASIQTARKAIDDGLIGTVTSFTIAANRDNNVLLSWASFLRMPGGGVSMDYGVYYLTALVSVLGAVQRTAAIVRAPYPTHVNIDPRQPEYGQVMDTPNESEVSAILQLRSGVAGTFHLNADSILEDRAHFVIYGTDGILYMGDANQFGPRIRLLKGKAGSREKAQMIELPFTHDYEVESRGLGAADLARAVLDGKEPRADRKLACHVLEVLEAMLKSGEDGRFHEMTTGCARPEPMPVKQA